MRVSELFNTLVSNKKRSEEEHKSRTDHKTRFFKKSGFLLLFFLL